MAGGHGTGNKVPGPTSTSTNPEKRVGQLPRHQMSPLWPTDKFQVVCPNPEQTEDRIQSPQFSVETWSAEGSGAVEPTGGREQPASAAGTSPSSPEPTHLVTFLTELSCPSSGLVPLCSSSPARCLPAPPLTEQPLCLAPPLQGARGA